MPLLSIITINRNNAEGLRKTIVSVLSQTFTDYEFIIIDGASTDCSVKEIKQYEDKITYWVSEPDKGIYNAMNKGILKATGEYCLFLNSGDWLHSEHSLENVFLQNVVADVVSANALFVASDLHYEQQLISPETINASDLILRFLPHQSTFIKRNLFLEIHLYDESLKISSDWAFFIECLLVHNKTYQKVACTVACCDSTGISSQDDNMQVMIDERKSVLIKLLPLYYTDYLELEKAQSFFSSPYYQRYVLVKDKFYFHIYFAVRRRLLKIGWIK